MDYIKPYKSIYKINEIGVSNHLQEGDKFRTVQEKFWSLGNKELFQRQWEYATSRWMITTGYKRKSSIKFIPVTKIKPSQFEEDYKNSSSEYTAKRFLDLKNNKFEDLDSFRQQDFYPIIIDEDYNIIDGNHRHYATKAIKQKTIPVIILSGKIKKAPH